MRNWSQNSIPLIFINDVCISEAYAVLPALEQFMEVSYEERREIFYRDVERGDMVIGRINSVRDFGLFVTLLCTAGGLERYIEDLEIKVWFFALCSYSMLVLVALNKTASV